VITELHPASADRQEARAFGLCWHPTPIKASWSCYEPVEIPEQAPRAAQAPATAPDSTLREVEVTFREYDIAQELLRTGGTNTEIGKRLFLSEDTVKSHMKKLLLRTGASTRSELIVAVFRRRVKLIAKPRVGGVQYGMIAKKTIMEDAL